MDSEGRVTATLDVLFNDQRGVRVLSVSDAAFGTATTDGVTVQYVSEPWFIGTERLRAMVQDLNGRTFETSATLTVTGSDVGEDPAVEAVILGKDPTGNATPLADDDPTLA